MLTSPRTGALAAAIRTGLGLSRGELAQRLGVSTETVKSWENDRRSISVDAWAELQALEDAQEAEIRDHIAAATPAPALASLPSETGPGAKPPGWQRIVAARVHRATTRAAPGADPAPTLEH